MGSKLVGIWPLLYLVVKLNKASKAGAFLMHRHHHTWFFFFFFHVMTIICKFLFSLEVLRPQNVFNSVASICFFAFLLHVSFLHSIFLENVVIMKAVYDAYNLHFLNIAPNLHDRI